MQAEAAGAKFRCEATLERELRAGGFAFVAGVDEVGRGTLFGPVVAGAVILPEEYSLGGLNDSKLLDPARREDLSARIREVAVAWAIAAVDAATIDRVNIYQASRLAMRQAVEQLAPQPHYLLVDAMKLDVALPQQSLIKGDARCHAIAAASIVAKVWRDDCMRAWHKVYPEYGLDSHKGYATAEHLRALELHGPTPLHRMTYAPVRKHSRAVEPADAQAGLFAAAGGQ